MTIVRLLCYTALVLLFAVAPVLAGEKLDLLFDRDEKFSPLESKSARDMMTSEEYSRYLAHIAGLECWDAVSLLNAVFVRTYPEFAVVKDLANESYDTKHAHWQTYAYSMFDELGLCMYQHDFMTAEAELKANGHPPTPYRHYKWDELPVNDKSALGRRNGSIGGIISKAGVDYRPALVMLSDLVRRGDLFDMGVEVEYFLLARACHLGAECEGHRARLSELGSGFSPERRRTIDRWSQLENGYICTDRMMRTGNLDDVATVEPKVDQPSINR